MAGDPLTPQQFDALWSQKLLILDGATGTELEKCGCAGPPPMWASQALVDSPERVQAIHEAYLNAGAQILIANTFRTNPRTLQRAGMIEEGLRLNAQAVELARAAVAASQRPAIVASSIAPVEDCYRPDLVPDEGELKRELASMMEWQFAAQPDLVWIETANNLSEVRLAAATAADRGLRFLVSLVLAETGRLLDGAPLDEAVSAIEPYGPLALGVNCVPPAGVSPLLKQLKALSSRRLLAYAHIGNTVPIPGWTYCETDVSPSKYATYAEQWLKLGSAIIGGCCGTTPEHIRATAMHLTPKDLDRAGLDDLG